MLLLEVNDLVVFLSVHSSRPPLDAFPEPPMASNSQASALGREKVGK
jgi:hypothetical protein